MILLIGSLLCLSTASADPIFIHLSLGQRSDDLGETATAYLKKTLEQRSSGRIRVLNSPVLPKALGQQTFDDLRSNRYQLALIDTASLTQTESALTLFDQPFLFDDVAHLHCFFDSAAGAELLEDLSHDGIIALSFWDVGFRQLLADSPLLKPQDVAGKVFGIKKQTASSMALEILGAEIRQLDNLQPGDELLKGAELSLAQMEKLRSLPANLTLSDHAVETMLLLSNQRFWSSLSEELKVILQGAIRDAALYSRELAKQARRMSLNRLTALDYVHIYQLNATQRRAWRKAIAPHPPQEADNGECLRQESQLSQP